MLREASSALPILQPLIMLQGGLSLCYFPVLNATNHMTIYFKCEYSMNQKRQKACVCVYLC